MGVGCPLAHSHVLNAFRHQRFLRRRAWRVIRERATRCSTPFGIKDFCVLHEPAAGPAEAQVLNAFRHQRFLRMYRADTRTGCSCAQRLSASKISACFYDVANRLPERCSTPFGIKDFCVGSERGAQWNRQRVLNAFRHQRFLRLARRIWIDGEPIECSTPFGIKDFCVYTNHCRSTMTFPCSTPFGIKDFCVKVICLDVFDVSLCSTPFGIKDFCVHDLFVWSHSHSKCSTPFGIKDFCVVPV